MEEENAVKLLKEVIETIEKVYGNSGYMQHVIYAANDGKDNWYARAKKAISENEKSV